MALTRPRRLPELRLRREILLIGVNPYVTIPRGAVARLSPRRGPVPVLVRINELPREPHRVNLMPSRSDGFRLYLNGIVRAASRTGVGERVDVRLSFDTEYRNGPLHQMPRELRRGLRESEAANRTWSALPPSRKKEVLRYFAQLKNADSRNRNVALALRVLAGSRERFLGRGWSSEVTRGRRAATRPREARARPAAQGPGSGETR